MTTVRNILSCLGLVALALFSGACEEPVAPVSVPDTIGMTQAAAEAAITGIGLACGTVTEQHHATIPAGDVISQEPVSGSNVAPGAAVDLIVSSGSPYSGGDGSSDSPYLISTAEDLLYLTNPDDSGDWDKHFVMTNDIDMVNVTGFTPIAPDTDLDPEDHNGAKFSGIFDGNGHSIQNLVIDLPLQSYVGLFGCLDSDGTVKNLGVEGEAITGLAAVGGLVGESYGTVTDCYATGGVTGGWFVGGLVGQNYNAMHDCHATSTVEGGEETGGLVGGNYCGTIADCYATGTVTGSDMVGGLAGFSVSGCVGSIGELSGCYATGAVTGSELVGGLVGVSRGPVSDCFATGTVTGDLEVGGLVGRANLGTVGQCYATGAVAGGDFSGGLIGGNYSETVTQCYATGTVTGNTGVGGLVGRNWDFSTVTQCYATGAVTGSNVVAGLVADNWNGTVVASFWNTETSGVAASAGGVGKTTAQMMTQSTFTGAGWDFVGVWYMLGGESYPYLLDLPVTGDGSYSGGCGTSGAPYLISTVQDLLDLANPVNSGDWDKHFVMTCDIDMAGVTGFAPIAPDTNLFVPGYQGVKFTGVFDGGGHAVKNLVINLPAQDFVGLFGYVDLGFIQNLSVVGGEVTGKYYIGGLVGFSDGTVTQCYAASAVAGDYGVGGLVGYSLGLLSESYATGTITGDWQVGGLVGFNDGTVTQCYATGTVTGTGFVGGLVGDNSDGSVTASFWDKETSGAVGSAGGEGKTTAQMMTESTFSDAGWDFVEVWSIVESESYPYLVDNPEVD